MKSITTSFEGNRLRTTQSNYPHGSIGRKKKRMIDSRLAALRGHDHMGGNIIQMVEALSNVNVTMTGRG